MLLANVHFMLQKRSEGNSIEIEGVFRFLISFQLAIMFRTIQKCNENMRHPLRFCATWVAIMQLNKTDIYFALCTILDVQELRWLKNLRRRQMP